MQLSCSTAGSIEGPFQFSNSKFGGSGEFQAGGWRRSIPVQDKAATKPQSSSAAQSSVTGSVDPVHKERELGGVMQPKYHRARPLLSPLLLAQLCPVHIERAGELLCVRTSTS